MLEGCDGDNMVVDFRNNTLAERQMSQKPLCPTATRSVRRRGEGKKEKRAGDGGAAKGMCKRLQLLAGIGDQLSQHSGVTFIANPMGWSDVTDKRKSTHIYV